MLKCSIASLAAFSLFAPCTALAQANPPALTWKQVEDDNGTLATRPFNPLYLKPKSRTRDNKVYPFGLPRRYSWYFGGESYLGEPSRLPPPTWTAMTMFHLIYPEAMRAGGVAKPPLSGVNVSYRKYQAWCHKKTGGWFEAQSSPPSPIVTGRFNGPQTGNRSTALKVVQNEDGSFTEPAPPPGWANHGWSMARGEFAAGAVDGCFSYFEVRADKPNANLVVASGIDWWMTSSAPYPQNTGYSMSSWKRVTTDWMSVTGSSLDKAILKRDPPPPLAGIADGGDSTPASARK